MLKVVSDVLTAMDRGQITLLGMFDLSAAFDTVDHAILLKRLEQVALQLFRDCSESVSRWMSSNRLKLNPLKTELIWLHSNRRNPAFFRKDIVLFGSPITPVNVVRNLGMIMNETMSEHIARVCRNCYYQFRQIRRIKRSLTANSIILLVLASVHSRLDCCNSVLYSLPSSHLQLLQSLLNSVARLI